MITSMFLENKYKTWYLQLTESRRDRGTSKKNLNFYTEQHHVIPRSLGGSNDHSNLVLLTAREHYLAHWLLTKITTGNNFFKMACAFYRMTNQANNKQKRLFTSRQYSVSKRVHARAKSDAYKGKPQPNKTISKEGIESMRKNGLALAARLKHDHIVEEKRRASISKAMKTREQHKNSTKNLNRNGFSAESRSKAIFSRLMKARKFVLVEGVACFFSISDAAKWAGISDVSARYRIESNKFNWTLL